MGKKRRQCVTRSYVSTVIISQLVMLFALGTVKLWVAALTSRYVKSSWRPFNIRPTLFMTREIFPNVVIAP